MRQNRKVPSTAVENIERACPVLAQMLVHWLVHCQSSVPLREEEGNQEALSCRQPLLAAFCSVQRCLEWMTG